ncbi:MAG: ATP-binding cassette domain-containing protein [Peptoniphilaceae bacterium]|nr:ATP-binding cassette domain-containing protein [Peptoniphilaceae bacterium]
MEQGIKREKSHLIEKILTIAFWIFVWAIIAYFFPYRNFLPMPGDVLHAMGKMLHERDFLIRTLNSVFHAFLGIALGSLFGALLGIGAARSHKVEVLFHPLLRVMQSVPVASLIVLALFWLSSHMVSVFISFLIVLPIVYGHAYVGWSQIDGKLVEVCRIFRISGMMRWRALYLPTLSEHIREGVGTAMGLGWKAALAAEVIGMAQLSIGGAIYDSKIYLNMDMLFAWTVWVVLLSALFQCLWSKIWKKWIHSLESIPAVPEEDVKECSYQNHHENGKKQFGTETGGQNRETILSLRDITVTFPGKKVLEHFHMAIVRGDWTGLSGASGTGKTTLLRVISGITQPDSGERREHKALRIAMQFQEDRLFERLTLRENLRLAGIPDQSIERGCRAFGMEKELDQKIEGFSGGMKRRTSLLRAVLVPGDLVLLDEPTAGLDEALAGKVLTWTRETILSDGKACVIASHQKTDFQILQVNQMLTLPALSDRTCSSR